MSNIYGKKISELHKSIINLGGTNLGITNTPVHICDGNGFSTGIEVSSDKVNMNLRRGVLSNFISSGSMPSAIYQDLNASIEEWSVSGTDWLVNRGGWIVLNLDVYGSARLHFKKDTVIRKFGLISKYFDMYPDNSDEYAGYWQRVYNGIRYYLTGSNKIVAQSELNDPDLSFLPPGPMDIDGYGRKPIAGQIIRKGRWKGVRHPNSSLEITLILSCDEDKDVYFDLFSGVSIMNSQALDGFLLASAVGGNPVFYEGSFAVKGLNLPESLLSNIIKITEIPKVYKFTFFNPSAWRQRSFNEGLGNLENPITEASPDRILCFRNGEDLLPNFNPYMPPIPTVLLTKLG